MLNAIKHALANLLNFEGRDARQTFWYWVLIVYLITVGITFVGVIPSYVQMITSIFRDVSRDPGNAAAFQASMAQGMGDLMGLAMWLSVAGSVLMLFLLAASFVRRLHDSDLSGWWALIPGLAQLGTLALTPWIMDRMKVATDSMYGGNPAAMQGMFQGPEMWLSFVGWIPWIAVIVLAVRKSSPGPNRYGLTSVSF